MRGGGKRAKGWGKRGTDVGLDMWKGRRCKAMIMVMDEGEDACWWLRPKEENTHTDCSCALGHLDSATCMEKKKKKILPCTRAPDTTDTCTVLFLQWKDGMSQWKSGRNHSGVMMWVQQWKFGVMQMLLCLEMQQCATLRSLCAQACSGGLFWALKMAIIACWANKQMTHWSALSACSIPEGSYLTVGAIKAAEWKAQWGERQESQKTLK